MLHLCLGGRLESDSDLAQRPAPSRPGIIGEPPRPWQLSDEQFLGRPAKLAPFRESCISGLDVLEECFWRPAVHVRAFHLQN